MQKNERLGRKYFYYKILLATIVLFFIGTLVGCSKDDSVETEEITAKVAGRIQNNSDLSGIAVKLIRINISGGSEIVSLKDVNSNSEGKFILESYLDGDGGLLVQADRDGKEWRVILTAMVKPGITVYSQPLNSATSISTDLYMNALESGRILEYTRIRLLIDEAIAETLDNYRELMSYVVNALITESDAEKETMLRAEIGGTTSQWQQIVVARNTAQIALDRDLYYAFSVSAQQTALYNYLSSISESYVGVGLQSDTFSKVLEASVRAFLKGIEGINSQLEFEFLNRTSYIRAVVLNSAVLQEFQKLGADPSTINSVINAGDILNENLQNVQSAEDITNEFNDYHDQVLEELIKVLGVYGSAIQDFQDSIADYKIALISEVSNSPDTAGIITAYINFYGKIKTLVAQQLNRGTIEQNAAAEVLILLNMYY